MKMRKKMTFLLIILALGTMTVSCKKKARNNKSAQTQISNKPINTDIFNLGAKQAQGNPNIQNLTPEEQQNKFCSMELIKVTLKQFIIWQ